MASVREGIKKGGAKGLPRSLDGLLDRIDEELAIAGAVSSVHGRTGDVVSAVDDYDGAQVGYTPAIIGNWNGGTDPGQVDDALDQLAARVVVEEAESPQVFSVFGRLGAVVAAAGDYDAIQVDNTPAGGIAATTVQAAINELDTEKARLDDLASIVNAKGASLVGIEDSGGNYAGATVEAALAEIGGGAPVDSVFGRTGAVVAASGDYDGAEVNYTPAVVADWDGSADPGQVDDALDQLAARMKVEEAESPPVSSVHGRTGAVVSAANDYDGAEVGYTPFDLTDWSGSADPGQVDDALDQLADRLTAEENKADAVFDGDAIHDNVAAEISVVTEKVTPVADDLLLIEDSAAANAKKRVKIGSLPPSAVAKAFLYARVVEQTTDLLVGDHVEFDDQLIVDASGDISLTVGAGQLAGLITLAAGKVYEVTAGIRADFSAAGGVVRFRLRDNTGAVEFGNQNELFARTGTSHVHSMETATGIIAPTVTTEIELRITAVVSLITIRGINAAAGQSYIKVVEIG